MDQQQHLLMDNKDITEVSVIITRDFGLNDTELIAFDSADAFKHKLTDIIRYLLDKDFEKLLHAMYRIDINEDKLKAVLASPSPDEVAPNLAQLVIEREMQKVETRRKYRS